MSYDKSNSLFVNLCIGGLSGIFSRTVAAPVDLYKMQLQTPFLPNSNLKYVIQHEGVFGLWKGNGINCFRIFPQTGIHFVGNNMCLQSVRSVGIVPNTKHYILAGTLGGIAGSFFTYPLETIRTRFSLQTDRNQYYNVRDAIKKISIGDCYRGVSMHLLGHVPFNALTFTFFHKYKQYISYYDKSKFISDRSTHFICGGLSGLSAVVFTYPSDIIRRRLQLQGFSEHVPKCTSVRDCIHTIYQKEGMYGYYRGLHAGMIRMFIAMSVQFTMFRELKNQIKIKKQLAYENN